MVIIRDFSRCGCHFSFGCTGMWPLSLLLLLRLLLEKKHLDIMIQTLLLAP